MQYITELMVQFAFMEIILFNFYRLTLLRLCFVVIMDILKWLRHWSMLAVIFMLRDL